LLHPRVFAFSGSPATWEQSLTAAVLAGGSAAAVSHRAGARLWGVLDDETVEITVPRNRSCDLEGVTVHRSRDLVEDHISRWKGFPVTKPARTIVDLGAVLPPGELEDVLDRALTKRLLKVAGVEWMLNELSGKGRHGTAAVAKMLDERALGMEPADGLLEPRMARLLRRAGLPAAEFQHQVHTSEGRFLARVDFAYPALLLAIEVDGFESHGTPRAMAKDFVRQNGLVPYGWRVLRFTWAQVVHQPDEVGATIGATRAALAA
jgi:very-short-patch-repair endonuclease